MIRPNSEIEFPPTEAQRHRAGMIARMESLNKSSRALMALISERVGAESLSDEIRAGELTLEQEKLIDSMRRLIRE